MNPEACGRIFPMITARPHRHKNTDHHFTPVNRPDQHFSSHSGKSAIVKLLPVRSRLMAYTPDEFNPYTAPRRNEDPSADAEKAGRLQRLRSLVLVVIAGAVAGSFFIGPFLNFPGDPTGSSIGAGLGGLFALIVKTVWSLMSPTDDPHVRNDQHSSGNTGADELN